MTETRQNLMPLETALRDLRDKNEHGLIISFGSHHDSNCGERGNLSVTIEKSGQTATSNALHLVDALLMARSKVDRLIEAERKRIEEEKESKQ